LIQPYFIQRIVDDRGNPLGEARPLRAGDEALRVIDARNAFIMDSMLRDVTRYGTAARAAKLGRRDLAGKTGTTNDFIDAWFCGYQPTLVGVAWVGFDQPKPLGRNQTGGLVSLPIWISFMDKALRGVPEVERAPPPGVVSARIDDGAEGDARVSDWYYREHSPGDAPASAPLPAARDNPELSRGNQPP
jgi:penicillin-binding protein 1A